ncbi:polyhydroxyalkanoate depolymerase [Aquidulcibacter sp.]|uniref:polyhydroxyalkanoate depolymerase n=1 Tax=Aquidulcibacter sp. TaxID=2052990 RepID=UPI0025C25B1A|nr:polyhydroxyalkanoate depolymerase [Aquidulcibacter sp.]MCA3692603.1 polyhydroxyalkanoate depolymerase [Aquidulcibacter sp.]
MLYSIVEMQRAAMMPWRVAVNFQRALLANPLNPIAQTPFGRNLSAASDLFEAMTRRYEKPAWRIESTVINGIKVPVTIETVWSSAWCSLVHFKRDKQALAEARGPDWVEPRVLIAAPLSGHFATLLRGTVEAFIQDHDVYITDWHDARDVPIGMGRFDLDDYIEHIREMLGQVGPKAHVVAVCQPGPPVLAAIALMAEDKDPALPASMTYMGSPIDARCSPTVTNKLAEEKPFTWFESKMIQTVPPIFPGAFRRVYPGFVQLASFMQMNMDRHIDAHRDFFNHLVAGDGDEAEKHREFYDEYLAVLDLSEEFYLQTIQKVFQEYHLPRGILMCRDRLVKPELIKTVALMTVEGEKDDISGIGQTQAAHDICTGIPKKMRYDYVQEGVGHYGVFNGRRFKSEIYPRQKQFIRTYFSADKERQFLAGG